MKRLAYLIPERDVSVIIVNYNGASILKACLDSLFALNTSFSIEVIVVDNASKDDSAAVVAAYPSVVWIQNHANVGFSRANNQGVACARGEWVFLLNNDTVVLPNALDRLMAVAKVSKKVGMVGPRLRFPTGKIQPQGGILGQYQYRGEGVRPVSFMMGAAILMRRSVYLEVGGLDPNYLFYNEDIDLCKTLIQKGYYLYYVPEAEVIHFQGVSTRSIRPFARVEGVRGGLYLVWKHYPLIVYLLYSVLVGFWAALMWLIYAGVGLFFGSARELRDIYARLFWIVLTQERVSRQGFMG